MELVDINDVRVWFGDGWRVNSRRTEYEHAERTLMRIGCDAHGWYYEADTICVAAECKSLRELAAKVRAWHLKQARAIRLEWDAAGSEDVTADVEVVDYRNSPRYRYSGFTVWLTRDAGGCGDLTTEQATALRDWLDDRLAMVPPKEDA